jgi:hypothetical protein
MVVGEVRVHKPGVLDRGVLEEGDGRLDVDKFGFVDCAVLEIYMIQVDMFESNVLERRVFVLEIL